MNNFIYLENNTLYIYDLMEINLNKDKSTESLASYVILNLKTGDKSISSFDSTNGYKELKDFCNNVLALEYPKDVSMQYLYFSYKMVSYLIDMYLDYQLSSYKENYDNNQDLFISNILKDVNMEKAVNKKMILNDFVTFNKLILEVTDKGKFSTLLHDFIFGTYNPYKIKDIDYLIKKHQNSILADSYNLLKRHMVYVNLLVDNGYQYDHAKDEVQKQQPLDINYWELFNNDVAIKIALFKIDCVKKYFNLKYDNIIVTIAKEIDEPPYI